MLRKNPRFQAARSGGSEKSGPPPISKPARRGAAVVEFAFVAPLVFLLFFAAIEFGRVLMVVNGLETAARDGCRLAIARGTTERDVEKAVAERLNAFGVPDYDLTVDPSPPTSACQWEPITVQIAATYGSVSWLPVPKSLKALTLTASCTLPQESDECNP
ncbi:MAG: TadE family protein [Planctomycetota bacterium]